MSAKRTWWTSLFLHEYCCFYLDAIWMHENNHGLIKLNLIKKYMEEWNTENDYSNAEFNNRISKYSTNKNCTRFFSCFILLNSSMFYLIVLCVKRIDQILLLCLLFRSYFVVLVRVRKYITIARNMPRKEDMWFFHILHLHTQIIWIMIILMHSFNEYETFSCNFDFGFLASYLYLHQIT